jgi:hypothetical protein
MYSSRRAAVKPGTAFLPVLLVLAGSALPGDAQNSTRPRFLAGLACDDKLTALFTPPRPELGRYEVCVTPQPLASIAPEGWRVERLPPLDAFGAAGPYNRSVLVRLYGGQTAGVARGWFEENGVFEAITLVSPHPDPSLTELMQGTMVIRFIICCT